ncbi:Multidrug resistance operon repressor [Marinomonas gallaica]|uniref:Multidrug resistance operon repressor n=1 Tax=Marinomonas gallaica TaxID=1806667 RepID=A0A1C3JNI3_9GAMM|nr:MarR family transcriptional regulator [Marinomonas gallaica]SBT16649.1 Multidrug resistance operon repressor [Marinomonas gallaica]SBT20365.1 Multidrug resistance operon repressor [Marinomonas gallaica]
MQDHPKKSDQNIDFGVLDEFLGYRLRRAQMNFFAKFGEVCDDLGISPGLFAVLAIVDRNPGLTQTAVAQALGNDRSAMVAAVDKLEGKKLLERRPAANDRRSYALFMTEEGTAFFANAVERVSCYENEMAKCLESDKEKQWLLDMLERLAHKSL